MEIYDGLERYLQDADQKWISALESRAAGLIELIKTHNDNPPDFALQQAKDFLIDVEKWKANCLQSRVGNAEKNNSRNIWFALLDAIRNENNDVLALQSIMQLKGFGSAVDDETGQRRAKVATSVLRFLWPDRWGVIDWRIAAILGLLKKHKQDVDLAISEARRIRANEMRQVYDLMNEYVASEINKQYRVISSRNPTTMSRAADVDMAIFGLSLMAWEMS